MVQSNINSNSDGPVTGKEPMVEILKSMTGLTLIIHSNFGNLSLIIQSKKEKFGYLPEILYSILRCVKAGNISAKLERS